jgi:uncharacterized protein DUF4258
VFDHVLQRMREKVRALDYMMTIHSEEMEDDDISILDMEHVILSGEIIERQQDQETGEWKYLMARTPWPRTPSSLWPNWR